MPTTTAPTVQREDLNPCTIQLTITCTPEQVSEGFNRALREYAKVMKIPGFRPGQAPKSMVEKMIAKQDLYNQAADEIIRKTLGQAMADLNITPHDAPAVSVTKLEQETNVCEFTAKVPLAPIVEIGDYKSLTAERPPIQVTDEEVDAQIEELRKHSGKREAITDRGAEEGDVAVVNIKQDGEAGDGRSFMSIVGRTFPQLDEALSGMRAEEMKHLDLTFPANFQEKEWAGKSFSAKVTLKSVNSVRTPDLTDDFAQALKGELKSGSLEELKKKVRERMEAAKAQMATEFINEKLQAQLLAKSTVHVPDTMWEAVANQRLREIDFESRQKGKTLEDYAKENGTTLEQMVKDWQEEAKIQVQRAVIAREIFVREKLQLTNEDLNQMVMEMAYEYQMQPQDLVAVMEKNKNFQELEIRAVFKKVVELLNQNATITDGGSTSKSAGKSASAEAKSSENSGEIEKPKKAAKKKAD